MIYHVMVLYSKEKQFMFKLNEAEIVGRNADDARRWFDREFNELQCEPTSRVGKVLIIDKILSVAHTVDMKRFESSEGWAHEFARNAAVALGRDTIRVDLSNFTISY